MKNSLTLYTSSLCQPSYLRTWCFKFITGLFLFTTTSNLHADDLAAMLQPYSIKYKVRLNSSKLGNTTLGKVETNVSKTDTGFLVQSIAKSQGMGAILLGRMQEKCQFSISDKRAISHDCIATVGNQDYPVSYSWPDRKLSFSADDFLDMPQGYVMNITVMPFAIAALKGQNLDKEIMYVVDAKNKRIRGYRHRLTEAETIQTTIGDIDAVKVVLERELKPERTITMWLSPEHDYLPIRMEEHRKSRVTTLSLISIDVES